MNIHLIRSKEYFLGDFEDVCEYINSLENLPFNFHFHPLNDDNSNLEINGDYLTWNEFFALCSLYRKNLNIADDDMVVLLTEKRNNLNWFSFFDKQKNIIINTSDWALFLDLPSKYSIVYDIFANILQYLLVRNLNEDFYTLFHTETLGCINDFCQNKKDVILRLRTADICGKCISNFERAGIEDRIILFVLNVFESIRKQVLFSQGFTKKLKPKEVRIDSKKNIFIGEKKLKLTPMEATLFIFFLMKKEGVSLNDLHKYRNELLSIYKNIRPGGNEESIDELIRPYYENGTFSVNKSRLNKKIRKAVGEPLANYYTIERVNRELFKINLSPAYVVLEFNIFENN